MTTVEQNLWIAVIAQAFTDASKQVPNVCEEKQVTWKNDTMVARTWLNSNSDDFKKVCHLACVNSEWVQREWHSIKDGNKKKSVWYKAAHSK